MRAVVALMLSVGFLLAVFCVALIATLAILNAVVIR